MQKLWLLMIFALFTACKPDSTDKKNSKQEIHREISFYTPDSIQIFGDLYENNKESPTILLFHQSGSNARAEYQSIIPKLTEKGCNVLAIDQRVGGQIYGSYNRTLTQIKDNSYDNPYSYCDAYNNLESALDFVIQQQFTGPKVLWGSSYSASLAIQLASNRGKDIKGVLAFSPASGGPMEPCKPDLYFDAVKVPLLLLRPSSEMESEKSKAQFKLAEEKGHETYVAQNGVHGSSMLVSERVKANVDDNWTTVQNLLSKVLAPNE